MEIIRYYGNVPINRSFVLEEGEIPPTNNSDFQTGRNEVFAFVEEDLLSSLENISTQIGTASLGRFNEMAVRFVLAKLYLNAEIYIGTPNVCGSGGTN